MKEWEAILISVVVTVVVTGALEFTRPKGARIFNRGKDGEDTLLFDPASKPVKK